MFYGHAKEVTSEAWGPSVRRWTETMCSACLDHWPVVQRKLVDYPLAGAFQRLTYGFPGAQADWHHSGSFRWMRNADLFARNRRNVDAVWIGSENHVALLFRREEAGCLFGEFAVEGLALYTAEYWRDHAGPAVEAWHETHLADRWAPQSC